MNYGRLEDYQYESNLVPFEFSMSQYFRGESPDRALMHSEAVGLTLFICVSLSAHLVLLVCLMGASAGAPVAEKNRAHPDGATPDSFNLLGVAIEVAQDEPGDDLLNTPVSLGRRGSDAPVELEPKAARENKGRRPQVLAGNPQQKGLVFTAASSQNKSLSRENSQQAAEKPSPAAASLGDGSKAEAAQKAAALGVQAVKEGRAQLLRAFAKTLPQAAAAQKNLQGLEQGVRSQARISLKVKGSGRLDSLDVLSASDPTLREILERNALFLKRGHYRLSPEKRGTQSLSITLTVKHLAPSLRYEEGAKDLTDALGILENPNSNEFRTPRGAYLRFLSGRYFEFLILDTSPKPIIQ